jgi:hypothetical protein
MQARGEGLVGNEKSMFDRRDFQVSSPVHEKETCWLSVFPTGLSVLGATHVKFWKQVYNLTEGL